MPISVQHGNVLEVPSEALILTVDGAARGMAGNVARQFGGRYPDDWEDMQREIQYPIPLGRAIGVPWDGDCPWRLLLIASTLHHVDVLSDQQKARVVRAACSEALGIAVRHRVRTVASALMQGGWRLTLDDAFRAMSAAYDAGGLSVRQLEFKVCVADPDDVNRLKAIIGRGSVG